MPAFVDLQTEPRLRIYDDVLHEDLTFTILKGYRDQWRKGGFYAEAVRNELTRLSIPWVALSLTCKSIRKELRSHTEESRTESGKRTHAMNLAVEDNVDPVTWHKLPCAPSDAQIVNVDCIRSPRFYHFWGNGGPRGVVRSLYQLRNVLLHCSPPLDPTRPLKEPMCLLGLRISVSDGIDIPGEDDYKRVVRGFDIELTDFVSQLASTGLLHGYVGKVWIIGDGEERCIEPCEVVDAHVPESWDGYGFEWGVPKRAEEVPGTSSMLGQLLCCNGLTLKSRKLE